MITLIRKVLRDVSMARKVPLGQFETAELDYWRKRPIRFFFKLLKGERDHAARAVLEAASRERYRIEDADRRRNNPPRPPMPRLISDDIKTTEQARLH